MKYYTLIALICSGLLFSQTSFQPGYYVDNESNKISGLIKNEDWSQIPSKILFKKHADDEAVTIEGNQFSGFKVEGTKHYYRTLKLDSYKLYNSSGDEVDYPSIELLARVVIDGQATFLTTKVNDELLYVIQIEDQAPQVLMYKKYILNDGKIRERKGFQKQLFDANPCEQPLDTKLFLDVKYRLNEISNIVTGFNDCLGSASENYNKKRTKGQFNLLVKANVVFNNFQKAGFGYGEGLSSDGSNFAEFPISNQTTFGIGLELEYMLPFNNKRWSIFTNPMYQYLQKDSATRTDGLFYAFSTSNVCTYTVDLSYIELPIGVRYFFVQSNNINAFVNVAFGTNIVLSDASNLEFVDADIVVEERIISSSSNSFITIGGGVRINSKFDVYVNYYASKSIASGNSLQQNDLGGSINMGLGYKLF